MINHKYLDTSLPIKSRIENLIEQMSLEEKINQIACRLLIAPTPEIEETLQIENGIGQIGVMSGRGKQQNRQKCSGEYKKG